MRSSNIGILVLCILVGLAIGVGVYTFIYAKGGSYMTNDPAACANCHIMNDHYDSWLKSSHRSVAACNDCHTPPGTVAKYMTKASNGFWHSWAFTTGDFPDPLRIKPHNHDVTEQACRGCHQNIVHGITAGPHMSGRNEGYSESDVQEDVSCVRCHRYVGHWVR